ncbi:MAG TPA: hypothetical protein VFR19_08645 [Hyphomicrobiaceae bacterium]|jgi:hypothetical protein|nr:hypothetical protein [Hyphomicrobiaceae bacterium]
MSNPQARPETSVLLSKALQHVRRSVGRAIGRSLLVIGLLGGGLLGGASLAEAAGLEGSWSGGGTVRFASGAEEQARCRAHYSRRSNAVYVLRATCATASGKAAQSATLQKVGDNRYSGTFYNSDYDITGRIYVILRGSSQSVRLTSSSGSASFRLSR